MKCGIEIHQRLATGKLFCRCSSEASEDAVPESALIRRLRSVRGELGELDATAKFEEERRREFLYKLYPGTTCLVEDDEEPPHPMNHEAVKVGLAVCSMLKVNPVDEIQVMRKIVVDGSNTSGFQRTSVIGMNGEMETSKGTVHIMTVCLEEESAGILPTHEDRAVYRIDRLGIPLVEIATAPEILDAQHCREVAEKLGTMLRLTGKAQRGIGTIRQDLNVSIEGGARVEIKGCQDLALLSTLVGMEVKRQESLLKIIGDVKKSTNGKIEISEPTDLSPIFSATACKMIAKSISEGKQVFGIRLGKHKGILGTPVCDGRRYGTELSDYAKPAGVKGIIHSDEDMKKYSISEPEIAELKKELKMSEDDAFVLVVAERHTALDALSRVKQRAAMLYVPEETRRAMPDGSSAYMRPLPGKSRMYPETDVPPVRVTKELLGESAKYAGAGVEEKLASLETLVGKQMAGRMLKSRNLPMFEKLVGQGADPVLAAATLEETLVSLRRAGVAVEKIAEKELAEIFALYSEDKIVKAAIPEIITALAKAEASGAQEAVRKLKLERITGAELKKLVDGEKGDIKGMMGKYRLRVDGKELQSFLLKK